jgi:hypothetical protein
MIRENRWNTSQVKTEQFFCILCTDWITRLVKFVKADLKMHINNETRQIKWNDKRVISTM